MSSKHRGTDRRRALAQLERKPAALGQVHVEDPTTIGLDRTIKIDLSKLIAPTNLYDADFAWIVHRAGSVSLFFAKQSYGEDESLRTRLELRYPPENLVHHFWKNSREFHARLRQFVEKWPQDLQRPELRPDSWKSARDHSDWVNFEAISHAGTEATIDFYQLPPPGLARFNRGLGSDGLKVVPIVRVQTTSFELLRLLDAAAEVVTAIEKYLPSPDVGESK